MSIYEKLKQSIKESEYDRSNNDIKWIAQFNSIDDEEKEIIKLGVRKERHLFWIYFSFDINVATMCASSEEETILKIDNHWGQIYETFKWI